MCQALLHVMYTHIYICVCVYSVSHICRTENGVSIVMPSVSNVYLSWLNINAYKHTFNPHNNQ